MTTRRDRARAARGLQLLLAQVEAGRLTADTPTERALVRRLEGAAAALVAADQPAPRPSAPQPSGQ